MRGEDMTRGAHGTVGEDDRVRGDAGQRQRIALEGGAARVHDGEGATGSDDFAPPIDFFAGWLMASSADASCGRQNMPAITSVMQAMRVMIMDVLPP